MIASVIEYYGLFPYIAGSKILNRPGLCELDPTF